MDDTFAAVAKAYKEMSEVPDHNIEQIKASDMPLYQSMGLVIPKYARPRRYPERKYTMVKRKPAEPKEQRPASFVRSLGMTYPELERKIRSDCCEKVWRCYTWVDVREVMQARAKTCAMSLKEVSTWVKGQLESFTNRNNTVQYMFRTSPVCKRMWMRIYGIGARTLKTAHKLLRNDTNVYLKHRGQRAVATTDDVVAVILCEKFAKEAEICSDGKWKMQDMANKEEVHQYVKEKRAEMCRLHGNTMQLILCIILCMTLYVINVCVGQLLDPANPPHAKTIRRVWRLHYSNVIHIRGPSSCLFVLFYAC